MSDGVRGWLRGETPGQLRRHAAMMSHPIRWALIMGAAFGFWMGASYMIRGAGVGRAAAVGVVTGLLFGPTFVWWIRRKARREAAAPGAPDGVP